MTLSSFFTGYQQRPVDIRGVPGKAPLFYPRLNFMAAVFPADLATVAAAMPDAQHRPLRIAPRLGLAAVHCLEYQESDVGPYNEVSLSFPIQHGAGRLPGSLALLGALLLDRSHARVHALPVTTEVALHGGVDFFNYPKFLADITFHESASHRVCTLRDRDSLDLVAEFAGRKLKTRAGPRAMALHTYPVKDGHTLHARVRMNLQEYAVSRLRDHASLTFSRHPRAAIFEQLKLGRPLMYFYVTRAEAMLLMPEQVAR